MFTLHFVFCGLPLFISDVFSRPEGNIFDKFKQNDFRLKFERLELMSYNKQVFKQFKMATNKYNRTTAVVNATIESNFDFGTRLEIISQVYKFMSNEYRYFPIRLQANICQCIARNVLGVGNMFNCNNNTLCPLRKGKIVRVCNWAVDESQYPPFMPNGRYMVEHEVINGSTNLALIHGYAEVYRPIPILD